MVKPDNRGIATKTHTPPVQGKHLVKDPPISLATSASGGANGADARFTNATNVKRRSLSPKSRINRRPKEATRAPKVHASRPNHADLPKHNPRPAPKVTHRRSTRVAIATAPTPNHLRPIKGAI